MWTGIILCKARIGSSSAPLSCVTENLLHRLGNFSSTESSPPNPRCASYNKSLDFFIILKQLLTLTCQLCHSRPQPRTVLVLSRTLWLKSVFVTPRRCLLSTTTWYNDLQVSLWKKWFGSGAHLVGTTYPTSTTSCAINYICLTGLRFSDSRYMVVTIACKWYNAFLTRRQNGEFHIAPCPAFPREQKRVVDHEQLFGKEHETQFAGPSSLLGSTCLSRTAETHIFWQY